MVHRSCYQGKPNMSQYFIFLYYFISYINYCKFELYTDVLVFITDDGHHIGRNASGLICLKVVGIA
jgi:hypothetical protein